MRSIDCGRGRWIGSSRNFRAEKDRAAEKKGVEDLVTGLDGLVAPVGIGLDPVVGKVYWNDRGTGKLQRANLDGSFVEDVVTIGGAHALTLDLAARKVYWTKGSSIERASFDGTSPEVIAGALAGAWGITRYGVSLSRGS